MATEEYGNLYEYNPSLAAAALFAALFGLSTAFHAYQLFRWKTWYFIVFFIGNVFQTVGYAARAASINEDDPEDVSRTPFIIQTCLILLAPALYAASIYMMLGRLVTLVEGERYALIKPRWITIVFVTGDVVSFMTQGAGGGLLASGFGDEDKMDLGQNLIIGGLFVQLIVFGFFIVLTGLFHYRILRSPTTKSATISVPWGRYLYILYFVSGLIMIRSIFRAIEYIEGRGGYLQTHEVFFYVLDTTLMFFVSVTFNAFHPSRIISSRTKEEWPLSSVDRDSTRPYA